MKKSLEGGVSIVKQIVGAKEQEDMAALSDAS
jgi:hypothetical protein